MHCVVSFKQLQVFQRHLLPPWGLCLYFYVKVEAAVSFKILVTTYMVFQLPEDHSLSIHHCENLKSHEDILQMLWASHGSDCEDCCLPGRSTTQCGRSVPVFYSIVSQTMLHGPRGFHVIWEGVPWENCDYTKIFSTNISKWPGNLLGCCLIPI